MFIEKWICNARSQRRREILTTLKTKTFKEVIVNLPPVSEFRGFEGLDHEAHQLPPVTIDHCSSIFSALCVRYHLQHSVDIFVLFDDTVSPFSAKFPS